MIYTDILRCAITYGAVLVSAATKHSYTSQDVTSPYRIMSSAPQIKERMFGTGKRMKRMNYAHRVKGGHPQRHLDLQQYVSSSD